jgi:peptidoglycan/xylan/chitin deacetylase (PgdA/CDA1 family)
MKITRREFCKLTIGSLAFPHLPNSLFAHSLFKVPVLLYHEITHRLKKGDYSLNPANFASQMEWLYSEGYKTLFITEIDKLSMSDTDKYVIITFDGGSLTFMDYAFPILKEYGFKVTMNIVGAWTDSGRKSLSWDECRYLKGSGIVDFGCHSFDFHNYPDSYLKGRDEEIDQDMKRFQEVIKRELGVTAEVLSFPFGKYNEKTIKIAQKNGFKYLLTFNRSFLDDKTAMYEIPRINIGKKEEDIITFRQILGGRL